MSTTPLSLLCGTLALLLPLSAFAAPNKFLRATPPGAPVRVNTLGFEPTSPKLSTTNQNADSFSLINLSTGEPVYTGKASAPLQTAATDTNETVRILDFSAYSTPGRYLIEVEGGARSAPFEIAHKLWDAPYAAVLHGMYLWRCGIAINEKWQGGSYHQDACHLSDGALDLVGGNPGQLKDSTKGWHDAGDYNKYVINAGVTVGMMFKAWEHFRPRIEAIKHGIPESGQGLPDLLAELKWEYDWLFTMQMEDGRVYHKLSSKDFRFWGKPDGEKDQRYFSPWSSAATADFTAMMALGARHFKEFDAAYAARCLAAAELSYSYLSAHPEDVKADLKDFHTGAYQCDDATARIWAAAELYETTGSKTYLADFEERARNLNFTWEGPTWGNPGDLALGTYVTSKYTEGRDTALMARLTENLEETAQKIRTEGQLNPHGRPYGQERNKFYWGCNGSVAGQTYLLHIADLLKANPQNRKTALDALAYLFGRNYHGRSYVTGLGFNPPVNTHDRRGTPQLPGYLVGGPWPTAREWFDELAAYEHNEIAINWNGSLIYALAGFVEE